MKITIRKGMFETNSSSMHSIIIGKEVSIADYFNKNEECWDKSLEYNLSIDGESYTRGEGRILLTPFSKTKFLMALFTFLHLDLSKNPIELNSSWEKEWNDFSKYISNLYLERGYQVTLSKPTIINSVYSWTNQMGETITDPYIDVLFDTEGFPEFSEYVDQILNKDAVKNIIFNQKSFIIIGGDEYSSCLNIYGFLENNVNMDNYIQIPPSSYSCKNITLSD